MALRFSWRSSKYWRQLDGQYPDLLDRSELKTLAACHGVIRVFAIDSYQEKKDPSSDNTSQSRLYSSHYSLRLPKACFVACAASLSDISSHQEQISLPDDLHGGNSALVIEDLRASWESKAPQRCSIAKLVFIEGQSRTLQQPPWPWFHGGNGPCNRNHVGKEKPTAAGWPRVTGVLGSKP